MQPTKWSYHQAPLDRNDYCFSGADTSPAAQVAMTVTEMLSRRECWRMAFLSPLDALKLFLLRTLIWSPILRYPDCWQRPCVRDQLPFFLRMRGQKKNRNWREKGNRVERVGWVSQHQRNAIVSIGDFCFNFLEDILIISLALDTIFLCKYQ